MSFRFNTGSRGKNDLPEIMGGGVALFDADGDGLLDIFLCNGGPIGARGDAAGSPCRLYLNEGGWRFRDATATSAAPGPSFAMGAAVGDVDGDGRDDLFVTGWREQRLYRNLGDGRFQDVTRQAGLESRDWSTSAAFADLDADGDLDLYVCNYVNFDPAAAPFCAAPDGRRDYCGPEVFAAQSDRLYRNNGDGTFDDVSKTSMIRDKEGRGLGVLIADLDADGRLDIFVANDGTPNDLWRNLGNLTFEQAAERSGTALDALGNPPAGMGVSWGDCDGDGLSELFVSNYWRRATIGFRNLGKGHFRADVDTLGLEPTRDVLGFGLALADFDLDGDLDLLQANGHVVDRERLGNPFAMRPSLLRNDQGRFVDVSARAGPWFHSKRLGRGLAIGDLDNDGRPDAVVAALDAPVAVLCNTSEGEGTTVRLNSPRSTVGAKLTVHFNGKTLIRECVGGGSYLSASSREISIPRGTQRLDVTWPSGLIETWTDLPPRAVLILEEGGQTR